MRTFPEWVNHANAYLPLRYGTVERRTAENVVAHRMKFEPTPIFDSLNTFDFWHDFYDQWTRAEMMRQAQRLDIHVWNTIGTNQLKAKLILFWIKYLNRETFVPSSL